MRTQSNPERQNCVKKNAVFATCSLPGEKLTLILLGEQHRTGTPRLYDQDTKKGHLSLPFC